MRPVLALVVVVALLGGLQAYMTFRPAPLAATTPEEFRAPGLFALEITLTFNAGPDPFAVSLTDAPSILVTFRGKELLRITESVPAGEPIIVSPIEDLVEGENEFYVQANPEDQASLVARAIRVRVMRDGHAVAEESIWSEPGELVQGTVRVRLHSTDDEHDSHH